MQMGERLFRHNKISKISSFTGLGGSVGQSSIFTIKQTHIRNCKLPLDFELLICLVY